MANEEHLKILRQGVDVWNRWRKDSREIRPDLGGADLSEADFSWADLSNVDFHNASLLLARLINVNLDGANLTGTGLWETQRTGWSIKGVICEYVYWYRESKEKTEYAPGEFEKLFCQPNKD